LQAYTHQSIFIELPFCHTIHLQKLSISPANRLIMPKKTVKPRWHIH
jgi:hypothetical protein